MSENKLYEMPDEMRKWIDDAWDATHDAQDNEIVTLSRLRELATADAEGRVTIRPDCKKCKYDRLEELSAADAGKGSDYVETDGTTTRG